MADGINIPVSFSTTAQDVQRIAQQMQAAMSKIDISTALGKSLDKTARRYGDKLTDVMSKISLGANGSRDLSSIEKDFKTLYRLAENFQSQMDTIKYTSLKIDVDSKSAQTIQDLELDLKNAQQSLKKIQGQKVKDIFPTDSTFLENWGDIFKNAGNKSIGTALEDARVKASQAAKEVDSLKAKLLEVQTVERDFARVNGISRAKTADDVRTSVTAAFDRSKRGKIINAIAAGPRRGNFKDINDFVGGTDAEISGTSLRSLLTRKGHENQWAQGALDAGGTLDQILAYLGIKREQVLTAQNKTVEAVLNKIAEKLQTANIEGIRNKAEEDKNKQIESIVQNWTDNQNKVQNAEQAVTEGQSNLDQINSIISTLQTEVSKQQIEIVNNKQTIDDLQAEIERLKGEAVEQNKPPSILNRDAANANRQRMDEDIAGAKRNEQINAETQQFQNNLKAAASRWLGMNQIVNMVRNGIRQAYQDIQGLDKAMTNIAVVTNFSVDDLWGKINSYMAIAQQYGVTTQGVYEVSQIFYQQGLKEAEVMKLTTETLQMARIAGISYTDAADGMTVAIRAFNMEMQDAAHVTDVYSKIASITASSTDELIEAMSKTASSAANVGSSFENTATMLAVMTEATRESATNLGSALKSIISRYGEMKEGLSVDSEGVEIDYNKVDTALKSIGISLKDAKYQFRDFDDVIEELMGKWQSLDSVTQRY